MSQRGKLRLSRGVSRKAPSESWAASAVSAVEGAQSVEGGPGPARLSDDLRDFSPHRRADPLRPFLGLCDSRDREHSSVLGAARRSLRHGQAGVYRASVWAVEFSGHETAALRVAVRSRS